MDAGERRYRALGALALALVLCLFFRETLFGGKILSQADHLLSFAPWKETAEPGHRPANHLLEDQAILMIPWLEFAAERIRAGEFPLWNPYSYGGQPIHAANSGAFLWPGHLFYYLFPSFGFYAWSALFRLLFAGFFALLFLRRIGASRVAALCGGLSFALCGFLVAWLNHPHANVAILLPCLLWLVERIAAKPSWRDAAFLALAISAQFLGGHSQTSLHMLLVFGAYCLFRTRAGPADARLGLAGWKCLAAGGLLGALLAAPQLLPMAEYLKESRGITVLETLEQTDELAALDAAVLMVAPDHHGGPHTHDYTGPEGRNLNYNEIIGGYVGRVMLVLALAGVALRFREPRVIFLAAVVALSALVAWQVWPIHDAFRLVPKLRSTNPMRLLLYVAFGLSMLGALGLDALLARLRLHGGKALAVGLGCFAVVAIELHAWGEGYNPAIEPELAFPATPTTDFLTGDDSVHRVQSVHRTILRSSANVHYEVQALTGYDKIELRPMFELFELFTTSTDNAFISEIDRVDRLDALPLASLLGVKYFLAEEELPPPLRLAHTSPGGVRTYENPFVLPRAFLASSVLVIESAEERLAHFGAPTLDARVAVLNERPEHPLFEDVASLGPEDLPGDVLVDRYEPREVVLQVDARRPALLVLADAWAPGWSATVNGVDAPVERVDHALRGVFVDEGKCEVVLRYDPGSFRAGLILAGLALAGCAGLFFLGSRGL